MAESKIPNTIKIQHDKITFSNVRANENAYQDVVLTGFSESPAFSVAIDAEGSLTGTSVAYWKRSDFTFRVYVRNSDTVTKDIKVHWNAVGY